MMQFAVDAILRADIDVRVLHIAGVDNVVADRLSRGQFRTLASSHPDLQVLPYEPPVSLPGARGL